MKPKPINNLRLPALLRRTRLEGPPLMRSAGATITLHYITLHYSPQDIGSTIETDGRARQAARHSRGQYLRSRQATRERSF